MNIEKQIDYRQGTAASDIDTAEILLSKGKILYGLFFCHLSIEKLLKAHFVKANAHFAPKSHDLSYLLSKTTLVMDEADEAFLPVLMKYLLEGRYPDFLISAPAAEESMSIFFKTKKMMEWLTQRL